VKKTKKNIGLGVDFIRVLFEELDLHGLYRLIPRQKIETLVEKIYTERGFYVEQEATDAATSQKVALAKTCPYCQSPIFKDEAVFYCNKCHIPYHQNCWLENGCCAIPGCGHIKTVSYIGVQRNEKVVVDFHEENSRSENDASVLWAIVWTIIIVLMIFFFGFLISS
jgi:hypothetical protein